MDSFRIVVVEIFNVLIKHGPIRKSSLSDRSWKELKVRFSIWQITEYCYNVWGAATPTYLRYRTSWIMNHLLVSIFNIRFHFYLFSVFSLLPICPNLTRKGVWILLRFFGIFEMSSVLCHTRIVEKSILKCHLIFSHLGLLRFSDLWVLDEEKYKVSQIWNFVTITLLNIYIFL